MGTTQKLQSFDGYLSPLLCSSTGNHFQGRDCALGQEMEAEAPSVPWLQAVQLDNLVTCGATWLHHFGSGWDER